MCVRERERFYYIYIYIYIYNVFVWLRLVHLSDSISTPYGVSNAGILFIYKFLIVIITILSMFRCFFQFVFFSNSL